MQKERVLILCTGNSARSQMAEGLLRHDAGERFEVSSAGTKPTHVRPEAVSVMRELGIDLTDHRSKHVSEFDGQPFDYVITVCDNAKESCPVFPGPVKRIHWSFEDPAAVQGSEEERLDAFRKIRDQLRTTLQEFSRNSEKAGPLVQVFDPAMCCSTGVCGPSIDPALARFAADLDWLRSQGAQVERFNLSQQPSAFAVNSTVRTTLHEQGPECLPMVLVDGAVACQGKYPSRAMLAKLTGIELSPALLQLPVLKDSGCC